MSENQDAVPTLAEIAQDPALAQAWEAWGTLTQTLLAGFRARQEQSESRQAAYYAQTQADLRDYYRTLRRGGWKAIARERVGLLTDDVDSLDAELEHLAECLTNLRSDARFLRRDLARAKRALARLPQKGDDHGE